MNSPRGLSARPCKVSPKPSHNQCVDDLLREVAAGIADPSQGLPDAVFDFALKITPMVNVDLLVRSERGDHLLAWRADAYGEGWHIPGGIIRYNETIEQRIAAVAEVELSAQVKHAAFPADIKQIRHARGHFVSLLYLCELSSPIGNAQLLYSGREVPRRGQIAWHKGMPRDMYGVHEIYREWLEGRRPRPLA